MEKILSDDNVKTFALDHLGLVSTVAQKLGIVKKIDQRLPTTDRAKVSMGQRVLAFIINGLGFTNDRMYLMPRFFKNKPIDRLIGHGIQAEDLNDDALGRCLDAISEYGTTRIFSEISFEIGSEQNLLGKALHLDTSSITLQGDYPKSELVTHGHSKDHRPDLKQVVLSLTTTGSSAFPLWMESLNGNSSDKVSFHQTISKIKAFQEQLESAPSFVWVADSALYSIEKLLSYSHIEWITRVPSTVASVKFLCETPDIQFSWQDIGNGYHIVPLGSNHGGLQQRWILVYSKQACQREQETFFRQLNKADLKLKKDAWHLSNKKFSTLADAEKACRDLDATAKHHDLHYTISTIMKHKGHGRPKSGQIPDIIGFSVKAGFTRNDAAIAIILNTKGRFVLASNQLDTNKLSDIELFQEYKQQSQVERGFRFLKDPWFMVDSIFLKNPKRIEALMMIMTLCLMVYNVGEHQLRESLDAQNDTLPNQLGKQVKNPTFRWIFQLMEGISVVRVVDVVTGCVGMFISCIDNLQRKIIHLFGRHALEIYGIA